MNPASIYSDFNALSELKAQAGRDADASLDQVARQFESLLIHQMLKSMRDASLGEGLFDSDQTLFYRDMFDQQLSLHLAQRGGIGLAAEIKRQLANGVDQVAPSRDLEAYRDRPVRQTETPVTQPTADGRPIAAPAGGRAKELPATDTDPAAWRPQDFVHNLWPWASAAARKLGLAPQALLAQAALETGWGRKLMRFADGSPANNLFGIKADHRWDGDRVAVDTLEFEQGAAVKKRAFFRAYDSFGESFQDYVDFLNTNPRYHEALTATADPARFFSALQRAGYATDPVYAEKINAVMNGVEMTQAVRQLKLLKDQPL